MEAARALADLVEISPQIEAAIVFGDDEEPLGAVGVSDWWATAVARAGKALLAGAGQFRSEGGPVTQLHASLGDGDVFVVGQARSRAIVAVTAPGQPAGLVFYDLKRCLASLAARELQPDPAPEAKHARRRWGRKRGGDRA